MHNMYIRVHSGAFSYNKLIYCYQTCKIKIFVYVYTGTKTIGTKKYRYKKIQVQKI